MDREEFKKLYPDIDEAEFISPSAFHKDIECRDIANLIDDLSFYQDANLTTEDQKIVESCINKLMDIKEIILNLRQSKLLIEKGIIEND